MFSLIFSYIKQHKWLYLVAFITLVVYDITLVMPTKISQVIMDSISHQSLTNSHLIQNILALVGIVFLNYGTAFIWSLLLFRLANRFRAELQCRTFAKMIKMRKPFYEKFRSGDILTRFTTDIDSIQDLIGYAFLIVIYAGGMIVFVVPTMLLISWKISLIALIPLLLMVVAIYFIGKYLEESLEANRESVGRLNDNVLEIVDGVRVIRAYSKKDILKKQFQEKTQKLVAESNKIAIFGSFYAPAFTIALGLATVIILYLGAEAVQKGSISLGQLLALQLYVTSLLEPFGMLSDFILIYQTGKVGFRKLTTLLETKDDLETDGEMLLSHIDLIEFKDYDFAYPQDSRLSLKSISVRISSGQTVGIVGPTGSGKTTFVKQFLRQYPKGQGSFTINHQQITDFSRKSLEQLIGYVPQEHTLFSKSVAENIAMGGNDVSQEELMKAIETASFAKDLKGMSDGLETQIGENGVSISGGQKQRISIARAFVRKPELLILDDSLSAVDAKTEQEIIRNIQTERKGKTTLIVTHRLSAISHADIVLVIDKGEIIASGSPQELLGAGGWYAEQFERQKISVGEEDQE